MPFNLPGTLAAFHALLRPRLVLPDLIVQDIRFLDFAAFQKAGYKGIIFDKDNCLTLPHQDSLIPDLNVTWTELKHGFGSSNVLIVSNSAGTRYDAGGLAAETVSYNLGVPVLRHSSLKPSYRTISAIRRYFSSLQSPIHDTSQLLVVGDRVLTDVVLANRLGAHSILVSRDWAGTLKSRFAGSAERGIVRLVRRWTESSKTGADYRRFTKEIPMESQQVKLNYSGSSWTWTGRALGFGSNSGKHR